MNIYTFHAASDIVVVGSNPEMADYDNPRGHIHGEHYYVVATNARGDRWSFSIGTGPEYGPKAEAMAAALQVRMDNLGKLPVAFETWQPTGPAYGSDAYVEYGADEEIAWERRMEEEEAWA